MRDAVELTEMPQLFEHWLAGRPLADRSRREYARNVRAYCAWLAVTPDRGGWQGDPLRLSNPPARDHAARDFRRYLQVERRAPASTVNLALASLDALYRCLGLGRPHVRRDKPALAAPRALDEAAQRRLLRVAEGAPVRARALVMLMLFTALRISETVALTTSSSTTCTSCSSPRTGAPGASQAATGNAPPPADGRPALTRWPVSSATSVAR